MSCEHLICANCAGLVADAGCPVCQEGRRRLHHHPVAGLTAPMIAAVLLLTALLFVFAYRFGH
jgi:hypothetical protein